MSFNWFDQGYGPEESYARQLDRRVAMDEYPYGYEAREPAAGHVNQGLIDDKYIDKPEHSQKLPWDYERHCETPAIPRGDKMQGSFPDHESKLKMKMGRNVK
jgi:hypothetical protein